MKLIYCNKKVQERAYSKQYVTKIEFCCEDMMKCILQGHMNIVSSLDSFTKGKNIHVVFTNQIIQATFCPFCGAELTKELQAEESDG